MSVGSEHRKRRMKAATMLTGAAAVLREYNQDHLARQVDEVSTGIATDGHYGRPVQSVKSLCA